MDSSNIDSVAVIANERGDQQLMSELLQKTGYNAAIYDNNDAFSTVSDNHSAIIMCHRQFLSAPLQGMPDCVGGQRVIVFSDCTDEQFVVRALEEGAHHFFNIDESPIVQQARLEAALRQHSLQAKRMLDVAPFKFNLERRTVAIDDKLINLSPKEYEFAYYLFANRHRVVVNSELMTSVWSLPSTMDARRIDTAACRVRKKMQLGDSSTGWRLRRIRRVGYELLWRGEKENTPAADIPEEASVTDIREKRSQSRVPPSPSLAAPMVSPAARPTRPIRELA